MDRRWQVVRIAGVPIYITGPWVMLGVLIAYVAYTPLVQAGVPDGEAAGLAVLGTCLFLGSVAVHEAAHAVAARTYGFPVYGITFVFWGGYTETPSSSKGPLREFVVAIVGPLATLLVAAAYWVLGHATDGAVAQTLLGVASWNVILGIGNAIPALPLDGGHALTAAVRGITRSRIAAERIAGYVTLGIGVALLAAGFISLRTGGGWWLVLLFIGFQMLTIGRGTEQRVALRSTLARGRVADAMRPPPDAITASTALVDAVERYLRPSEGRYFPVVDVGRVVGTISMRGARRADARDPMRTVRDAMDPIDRAIVLAPDDALDAALDRLGAYEGMVVRNGGLVGAIGPHDIQAWLDRGGRPREVLDRPPWIGGVPPRPDLGVGTPQ